jgi:CysZ protein
VGEGEGGHSARSGQAASAGTGLFGGDPASLLDDSMITEFVHGYRYGISGLRWLVRPGLRLFVFVPILLNAAVFATGTWWLFGYLESLQRGINDWLPDWLDWLSWLIWPLAVVAVLILVWSTFTMIANLLGSPFNGLLAERVQRTLRPQVDFPDLSLAREIIRAPAAELAKLAYFALLAVPVLFVAVIPVINVLAPLAWVTYGSWLLALEYCDYPLSNLGLRLAQERRLLRQHRWLALGFGAGVMTMTLVPVLNLVAMPAAVIGASRLWSERLSGNNGDLY